MKWQTYQKDIKVGDLVVIKTGAVTLKTFHGEL